jgi:hypothetical protein
VIAGRALSSREIGLNFRETGGESTATAHYRVIFHPATQELPVTVGDLVAAVLRMAWVPATRLLQLQALVGSHPTQPGFLALLGGMAPLTRHAAHSDTARRGTPAATASLALAISIVPGQIALATTKETAQQAVQAAK